MHNKNQQVSSFRCFVPNLLRQTPVTQECQRPFNAKMQLPAGSCSILFYLAYIVPKKAGKAQQMMFDCVCFVYNMK